MGKKFKNYSIVLFIILIILTISLASTINKVYELIDSKKYNDALNLLVSKRKELGIDYYLALSYIYAYNSKDYKPVLKQAKELFVDNQKENAIKDINFSKILYSYGYIEYYIKSEIYNAEIYLSESLRYYPDNKDTLITIAQLFYDKGELDKSEDYLDKAFEILKKSNQINENFLKIYNQVLIENKRYSKLKNLMKDYLSYDIVKLYYAKSCVFLSDSLEANEIIKDFIKKKSDNLEAYYILGLTYKDSRVKSNEGLKLIDEINPNKNDRYYLKLAQFYEGLGDVQMAINYYDKTLSLNKNNDKYYILAITYAIDTGFTSKAVNWAYEYYNKKPRDFYANLFLAIIYEYQKQFENSKKYYQNAIEIDPTRYEPYVRLSWMLLEQESDFNSSAIILLKGYENIKDLYYKNRIKKALKDLVDLEEEFKRKYKEKTNMDISKPIKDDIKEKIKQIINQ